jgi:multiple sugar transport system permease protein
METLRLIRQKGGTYAVVAPFAIVLAFPFYWMLTTMFKRDLDLYNVQHVPYWFNTNDGAAGWPWRTATFYHVSFLFKHTEYPTWLWNTLIVGGVVVAITLLFALPAGYALARLAGGWGQSMGVGIFMVYLVPPTLLFLPLSRLVSEFGLKDNWLWSLILVYPSFTIPFATWLLMGFFKTIPQELEDAALVDGCSRLRALWRIVFPISLPGILTVIIFSFSLCVNEFIYAFTFVSSTDHRTVSAGVPNELILGDVFHWQAIMAATLIPSIPLALLYNSFLDRFIKGFTGGAFR